MKKFLEFFVKYPTWSNSIIVVVLALGLISLATINRTFFPNVPNRFINIQVIYPGASPEEMEEGAVLKVEESLKGLEGVEKITSVSSENLASITVEGERGYDMQVLLSDVKNAVDRISSFPVGAEQPIVSFRTGRDRAAVLVIEGDVGLDTLKRYAERIEDDLIGYEEISQVEITGFPVPEISVEVNEDQLTRYGLTFDAISNAIRNNNTNISAGAIKSEDEELLIRANNKSYTQEGIGYIVVRTNPDGSLIRVRDVATVKEQFADVPDKTFFNGNKAVTITVNALDTEDILAITETTREYVEEYQQTASPVKLEMVIDRSEGLRERLNLLVENGGVGLILVLITLGLFLNLRQATWVSFGIPFSFMGMFIVALLCGITINMISLFGMILVIGIVVDDGIVVGENVYTHLERGKSGIRAAVDGTLEVLPSVYTSVITTVIVFIPFFFLDGAIGEFMWQVALVMIACLAFSLVECTFVLPAHLSHNKKEKKEPGKFRKAMDGIIDFLRSRIYAPVLKLALEFKYIAVTVPITFAMIVIGLFAGGVLPFTFFPPIDFDSTTINLVLPPGTRENVTERYLQACEDSIWVTNREFLADPAVGYDIVKNTRIDIGRGGGETGGHTGTLEVFFVSGEQREIDNAAIEKKIKSKLPAIPESELFTVSSRQIFGKALSISFLSKDSLQLASAITDFKTEIGTFSSLKDITDNNVIGKREVNLALKDQAYFLGLSRQEIARQIRQGFFGQEVQRLQVGTDEKKVWVRYAEEDRKSLGQLEEMKIRTPDGNAYPFSELATYDISRGIVAINHYNNAREIKVEADQVDRNEALPPILDKIRADVLPPILEQYPDVRVEFLGQEEQSKKFAASAQKWFGAALAFMLIVLTLTFRSRLQAFTVFLMIPLGVFGAFFGHWIQAKPVSILSIFGILALSGIVVNDAVVFLSKFNQLLRSGLKVKDAAFEAGKARFRAILLTSITTAVGLYPIIFEKSTQAQFLIPLAISVVYGVIIGTFFILLVFPALLLIFNDFRRVIFWVWNGRWPEPEEVEPANREAFRLKLIDEEERELAEQRRAADAASEEVAMG